MKMPFLSLNPNSPKTKLILVCVVFNLLLELWVHGIGGFLNPVLTISLFLIYLSYFIILVDLIVRFNLRDYHVLLIGFIYGMLQETLNTGSVFNDAFVLGVNPIYIFMANILWWGILQSVFAYYFAKTIVKDSEDEFNKMGLRGWMFAIGINVFFFGVLGIEDNYPDGTAVGYLVSLTLVVITIAIFVIEIKKKTKGILRIEHVRFVDTLMRIQIILCVVMGIMHTFILGIVALYLFLLWSVFTGIVYLTFALKGYRFVGRFKP